MAGKGGQDPNLHEVVINGPFKGLDNDTSHWYLGNRQVFNNCVNMDYLKGQLNKRAGALIRVSNYASVPSSAIGVLGAPAGPDGIWDGLVSERAVAFSKVQGSFPIAIGTNRIWPMPTVHNLPEATATFWNINNSYYCAVYIGLCSITAGGQITQVGDQYRNFEGCFVYNSTDGAGWYPITDQGYTAGVSTTYTTSGYNPGAPLVNKACYIAVPVSSGYKNPTYQCFARDEVTGTMFFGGAPGGVLFEYTTVPTPAFTAMRTCQTPTYYGPSIYIAKAAAFFAGRLVIATPYSRYADLGVWQPESHPGRIAFSSNRNFEEFDPTAVAPGGWFDTELGDVFSFFSLRDTLYAQAANGIFAIQRTGNNFSPFRYQRVDDSQITIDCGHQGTCVVDGAYAFVPTPNGPARFDGSRLQPIEGVKEFFRGNPQTGFSKYDPIRRRVFFKQSGNNMSVLDVDAGSWSKWNYDVSTENIRDITGMWSVSAAEQDEEYALVTEGTTYGIYSGSRSTGTDSGLGSLTWSFETAILDSDVSRDKRSLTRIRITSEVTSATSSTVYVDVFIDGGVTPAVTVPVSISGGTTSGQFVHGYATFAPVSGQNFSITVRGGSDSRKTKINQVALYFIERQEQRPN